MVTGATGNIGAPLIRELLTAGHHVRALSTDPAKAKDKLGDKVELVKGNFSDLASIDAAMKGATKLFALVPAGPDGATHEGHLYDAAKKHGVQHLVVLSVAGAQYDASIFGRWHRAGEKKAEASGIPWTFLRPVGFNSNAFMWAQTVKTQGAIYQPMGEGKMAIVDVRDIAAVAAKCLTSSGHANKAYDITGPEALSMAEQAKQLGDAIGKPLKYVDVPDAAARDAMIGMGFPPAMADGMLEFTGLVRSGGAAMVSDAVKAVTGNNGRTFAAWCRENAAAFKRSRSRPPMRVAVLELPARWGDPAGAIAGVAARLDDAAAGRPGAAAGGVAVRLRRARPRLRPDPVRRVDRRRDRDRVRGARARPRDPPGRAARAARGRRCVQRDGRLRLARRACVRVPQAPPVAARAVGDAGADRAAGRRHRRCARDHRDLLRPPLRGRRHGRRADGRRPAAVSERVDRAPGHADPARLSELARRCDVNVANANWAPGVVRVPGQGGSCAIGRDGAVLATAPPAGRVDLVL